MSNTKRAQRAETEVRRLGPLKPPLDPALIYPFQWLSGQWGFDRASIEALQASGLVVYETGNLRFFCGRSLVEAIRSGVVVPEEEGQRDA